MFHFTITKSHWQIIKKQRNITYHLALVGSNCIFISQLLSHVGSKHTVIITNILVKLSAWDWDWVGTRNRKLVPGCCKQCDDDFSHASLLGHLWIRCSSKLKFTPGEVNSIYHSKSNPHQRTISVSSKTSYQKTPQSLEGAWSVFYLFITVRSYDKISLNCISNQT